jgi:uncharacterized protein
MQEPFVARLPMGADLLDAIAQAFRERSVPKAGFSLIGAVTHAVVAFYDMQARKYVNRELSGDWEIAACLGNVSERDGETFVHAHVVLSGEDFQCVGGHLMPGTVIFAAELFATPLPGKVPVRKFDEATGLYLWSEA